MVEDSAAIDALLRGRKRITPDERVKFDVVDAAQFTQLGGLIAQHIVSRLLLRSLNANARRRSTLRECGSGFVGPRRIVEE
ncbi:MAG: hypothetical protein FJX40_14380 [Alphaproteobacteria bacterium]|nr:hypothetical protein [Alphaproteobacteria bacterium]MBM3639877.1 hypothetical protein [Alphaproteobacteria bacterium]